MCCCQGSNQGGREEVLLLRQGIYLTAVRALTSSPGVPLVLCHQPCLDLFNTPIITARVSAVIEPFGRI